MSDPANPKINDLSSAVAAPPRAGIDDDARPYTPPLPSAASRKISLRSKGSLRGSLVVSVDEIRQVAIESHIEKSVLLWLATHPEVVRIQEQPAAVPYMDHDDVLRHHTFDLLVHFVDGRRIFTPSRTSAVHASTTSRASCATSRRRSQNRSLTA